ANALYLSRSSWRVATWATGRAATGIFWLFLTAAPPPQPPEKAASASAAIHKHRRFIGKFGTLKLNRSNLATTSRRVNRAESEAITEDAKYIRRRIVLPDARGELLRW